MEKDLLSLQLKIIPEMVELLEKRYQILKNIYYNQPIGRRILSSKLNMGERIVRSEISFMKEQGLIDITAYGMKLTKTGEEILENLTDFIYQMKGLGELEDKIVKKLGISKAIIVLGDVDEDFSILKEIGRVASGFLKSVVRHNSVIAITGGSTTAEVANLMSQSSGKSDIMVIPARGGLGREVEKQANNIAAVLAKKLGGNYRLLHIPDNLSKEAVEALLNEPEIKGIVELLKKADIFLYGIGRADEMMRYRNLPAELMEHLKRMGAVSEAFGYYFNIKGEPVYATSSICLTLKDIEKICIKIAVAGGRKKAEAILSVLRSGMVDVIVTDEAAAKEILHIIEH